MSNVTLINATSNQAVGMAHLPPLRARFRPGMAEQRSNDGAIVVEDQATGAVLASYFSYGMYEFSAPAASTPPSGSAPSKVLLQNAAACFQAGHSFNATLGTCVPRKASGDPLLPAAFVGLADDGALVLAPPAEQSTIRVHGRIREVDELRDEVVALLQQLQQLDLGQP